MPLIAQEMGLDMSEIDQVLWYFCGECGGNQPALSSAEKAKMRAFYQALFVALGVPEENITFRDDLPSGEYYQFEDALVSMMEVEGTSSALRALSPEVFADAGDGALEELVVIPDSMVQFQPDSAEFLDPEAAAEALQPLADYLLEHPSVQNPIIFDLCRRCRLPPAQPGPLGAGAERPGRGRGGGKPRHSLEHFGARRSSLSVRSGHRR